MPVPAGPLYLSDVLRDPGGTAARVLDCAAPLAAPTTAALVTLAVLWTAWRRRCHQRLRTGARLITVLPPPTVDSAGGKTLWAHLTGLLRPVWKRLLFGQPHLAFEYWFSSSGTRLCVWVPAGVPPGLVERAIEAAWPGARTQAGPAEPPLPVRRDEVVVGGELGLARCESLPLRTDFDTDPLRGLLAAASDLGQEEYACVQVNARPVTGLRLARAHTTTAPASATLLGRLLDLITPRLPRSARRSSRTPQPSPERRAEQRAAAAKHHGSAYETRVRYAVTVPAGDDTARARERARGLAHGLATVFAAYTDHNHYTRRRLRHPTDALADRRLRRGDLLSVPELAAVAHLPTDESLPGVQRAGAKALAPPPGIAAPGPHAKLLGSTDAGPPRRVALRVADARHHLHVLGATGSGKSTLLASMILDDARAGRGAVVIDPKGDLVTDVLARLPSSAADRVVVFDADSRHRPPCLNPLDGTETDLIVDNLVSVFRRVYSAFWGPRTDDLLRAACLTLHTHHRTPTLADLPRLLTEPAFRARLTSGITDPVLGGFWAWYDGLTDASRSHVVSPLMNKLRAFLLRPFVRNALAAGRSTVDMREVLDGGLCLVRIPKGALGEETTRLVGSLIVAHTWHAATARAALPQDQRRDAGLVIDECHNFLNLPYPLEDLLAEARGFRLALTLAHQHLDQLPSDLREGIATNARNKIWFNIGPDDARQLSRHMAPHLTEHDLAHLGAYHAAARLVVHGEQTSPFTLTTHPLPPAAHAPATPAPDTPTSPQPRRNDPRGHRRRDTETP